MSKTTIFLALCMLIACTIAITSAQDGVYYRSECSCIVTKERKPVCGSNGVTYPNWRKLHCKNQCDRTDIKLVHVGNCKEEAS